MKERLPFRAWFYFRQGYGLYFAFILEPLPAPFKIVSCFRLILGPNWCNNDLLRANTCAALSTTAGNLFELIKNYT